MQGKDFLEIIDKYHGKSEILDCYCEYLKESLDWYTIHGEYDNVKDENFRNWYIAKYQIAQYRMMNDIFPDSEGEPINTEFYVRHGSNRDGSPWTQKDIMSKTIGARKRKYYIFWRIDTNSKGPYISLRFYDKYDKNDAQAKQEHINAYNKHRNQIEKIIMTESTIDWEWAELKGGYTAGYYEATLMTFNLKEVLRAWEMESVKVIQTLRKINECFIAKNLKE